MKTNSSSPFVHVTSAQARCYTCQAQQLLNDTLCEYDNHVNSCISGTNPLHDKWQWKPLATHEGLSVYKERQPTHVELNSFARRSSETRNGSVAMYSAACVTEKPMTAWAMAAYTPELVDLPRSTSSAAVTGSSSIASVVVVGHIDGNLSDAMYGLVATDTAALQRRLCYMVDPEMLNTAMISCIETPSAAEPFRFMGVQWVVRGEASRVNSSSRRLRDFVLLVASGVVRHKVPGRQEVQEIGYYLCQSVEIPEYENHKHTRGWLSTCSLFTLANEHSPQIDVFSRGYADFKGKMHDYQAATMMNSLMLAGVTEAASCGQIKKLSWLLSVKGAAAEFRKLQPETKSASKCCGICERKFGVLHSVALCTLCHLKVCSRCRVSRDLSFVKRQDVVLSTIKRRRWDEGHQASRQVQRLTAVFCKNCKLKACHMDASVMARWEVKASDGVNGTKCASLENDAENSSRTSPLYSPSDCNSEEETRVWTRGTNTATLRGCVSKATLHEPHNDIMDVVKTKGILDRLDSSETSCSSSTVKLDCSLTSTSSSPRDQDSSQEESSTERTRYMYESRQQHQATRYPVECPERTTCTYSNEVSVNAGQYQADLMRKMQELQKSAESVYQFTSKMSAHTSYRHEQFVSLNSQTSISELD
ncbi:unnamed protein product [Peronospora effusa]|uniref:FYVE-type domain-containing protein n=2 Tax=Peronospora effusa TaxID=542832 RepID=A0A3R7WPZ2_9STRA|nr:hypothetical protein DD237_005668 [Peronospora effusa]CAI5701296.1 unnamed protein product [Peronospora effusa]